jgi:hypothetical protein
MPSKYSKELRSCRSSEERIFGAVLSCCLCSMAKSYLRPATFRNTLDCFSPEAVVYGEEEKKIL